MTWVVLQKTADEIVRSKSLWKRFIDGTPLENDIACWMADFAEQFLSHPPAQVPLTEDQILHRVDTHVGGVNPGNLDNSDWIQFARVIEAAHGIGGGK